MIHANLLRLVCERRRMRRCRAANTSSSARVAISVAGSAIASIERARTRGCLRSSNSNAALLASRSRQPSRARSNIEDGTQIFPWVRHFTNCQSDIVWPGSGRRRYRSSALLSRVGRIRLTGPAKLRCARSGGVNRGGRANKVLHAEEAPETSDQIR
jgi:hypothetical protein